MRRLARLLIALLLCWMVALPIVALAANGVGITPISDVTVTSTATLIKATNAFRVEMSCTNHSTSVNVRWGDSSVTATKGQRIPAASSIAIQNRGPIYMISEGASVTVSCTEEAS